MAERGEDALFWLTNASGLGRNHIHYGLKTLDYTIAGLGKPTLPNGLGTDRTDRVDALLCTLSDSSGVDVILITRG